MSPHLSGIDVDAILARLRASGDGEAADALARMRDALARQDEALRDLVADARSLDETVDEDGSHVEISCATGSFDALATAFGYPSVQGVNPEAMEAAGRRPGGPEYGDGMAFLTPLEHLEARILTAAAPAAELAARGAARIEIPRAGGAETVFHERRVPPPSAPSP
jgi:hypothetical protein